MHTPQMPRRAPRIGGRIRAKITQTGATIAGLAETTGIPRATLHRKLDYNPGSFTATELEAIAVALDCSLEDLIGDEAVAS